MRWKRPVGWLERNRLADHAHLLDGDPRYDWTLRQRREWALPFGRAAGRPGRGSGVTRSGGLR